MSGRGSRAAVLGAAVLAEIRRRRSAGELLADIGYAYGLGPLDVYALTEGGAQ